MRTWTTITVAATGRQAYHAGWVIADEGHTLCGRWGRVRSRPVYTEHDVDCRTCAAAIRRTREAEGRKA